MSNKWADHYTAKAKAEGYRARSVYKLKEIQERFKILKPGNKVLDLGCYPGSWSQLALEYVGQRGKVFGIDIHLPEVIEDGRFGFHRADVLELRAEDILNLFGPVDVVLSDLAPATTGIHVVDCARSIELAQKAFELAKGVLKGGGNFVFKAFDCGDLNVLHEELKPCFNKVRGLRPKATRERSREVFTICIGFKNKQ